jgi:hypothetical protein
VLVFTCTNIDVRMSFEQNLNQLYVIKLHRHSMQSAIKAIFSYMYASVSIRMCVCMYTNMHPHKQRVKSPEVEVTCPACPGMLLVKSQPFGKTCSTAYLDMNILLFFILHITYARTYATVSLHITFMKYVCMSIILMNTYI